jgi:hypothetical protein
MIRQLQVVPDTVVVPQWEDPSVASEFQARARQEGFEFDAEALDHLELAGARVVRERHLRHHYSVDAEILTPNGGRFLVFAHGNVGDSSAQPGLRRTDTLAKVITRAVMLSKYKEPPALVVSSHLPHPNSVGAYQLADLHDLLGSWLADVVATKGDLAGFRRLQQLFHSDSGLVRPQRAPWWSANHRCDPSLFDALEEDSHA